MQILVHGGASTSPDAGADRQALLQKAAGRGAQAASPVDAVVTAVRKLEATPGFNAGVGSAVQSDGEIRVDAGIMTSSGSVGAACAMPGIRHAIEVARVVMSSTPHVLVSGEQAVDLAASFGIRTHADLWTDATRDRWDEALPPRGLAKDQLEWVQDNFGEETDTVGAVATDGDRIATATSTGGRWFALAGRVGDVPQIGAGFYASEAGGASATGAGEDIARATLARQAIDHLEDGLDPDAAASRVIEDFDADIGSSAGIIVMDLAGNTGAAFNTESMQTAFATDA
jgi:isoaspartyl peptidase/L-asparaginase-like protein (Ntn-hydrolase superfamily)